MSSDQEQRNTTGFLYSEGIELSVARNVEEAIVSAHVGGETRGGQVLSHIFMSATEASVSQAIHNLTHAGFRVSEIPQAEISTSKNINIKNAKKAYEVMRMKV